MYPIGYGSTTVTLAELKARHGARMHPEYRRRLFAWIEAQGGRIGIGGGFRTTQPAKPGFAPDGKSFHQEQTFASGFKGYAAVDLVHVTTGNHRSPTWAEVPNSGSKEAERWGLHCFISGEPWHMQCVEMRGWQTWVDGGRRDPKAGYPIPGGDDLPDPTIPPTGQLTEVPVLPVLVPNANAQGGWPVEILQMTLNRYNQQGARADRPQLDVDGRYGIQTIARVQEFQADKGIGVDGVVGPATWRALLTGAA